MRNLSGNAVNGDVWCGYLVRVNARSDSNTIIRMYARMHAWRTHARTHASMHARTRVRTYVRTYLFFDSCHSSKPGALAIGTLMAPPDTVSLHWLGPPWRHLENYNENCNSQDAQGGPPRWAYDDKKCKVHISFQCNVLECQTFEWFPYD